MSRLNRESAAEDLETQTQLAREAGVPESTIAELTQGTGPDALPLANRTAAQELFEARLRHEGYDTNMSRAEYRKLQELYVRGKNGTLTQEDLDWIGRRLEEDPDYFDKLPKRGYITGEQRDPFTGSVRPQEGFIAGLNPGAADDLKGFYERAINPPAPEPSSSGSAPRTGTADGNADGAPSGGASGGPPSGDGPAPTPPSSGGSILRPPTRRPNVNPPPIGPDEDGEGDRPVSGDDIFPPFPPIDDAEAGLLTGGGGGASDPIGRVVAGGDVVQVIEPISIELEPFPEGDTFTDPPRTPPNPGTWISSGSSDGFIRLGGGRDPTIQLMILDTSVDDRGPIELRSAGIYSPHRRRGLSRIVTTLAAWLHPGRRGADFRSSRYATASPRLAPTVTLTPSQENEGQRRGIVQVFLSSLGNSSGEAFEARFFNMGSETVNIATEGLVIEPLKKKAKEEAQRQLAKLAQRSPVTAKLNAYCLELMRRPPSPDMMFRIADGELQRQFAPMRRILSASHRLQDAGLLSPDTDPLQYFHATRQWAIWTKENGFDQERFGKAFLERIKKNFEAARQPWNQDVERAVRSLVPNRWRDVEKVLREAGLTVTEP